MPPAADVLPLGTALLGVVNAETAPRRVNLVLPTVARSALFAGIRTAIHAAVLLAEARGCELRILTFDARTPVADVTAVGDLALELGAHHAPRVDSVWSPFRRCRSSARQPGVSAHPDDIWVATYWTTAHALEVAADAGHIDRDRVICFVQDHEPSFFPASTESALARSTYHAGFRMVVNSAPLRQFIADHELVDIAAEHVFRPALDVGRLERTSQLRTAPHPLRIGFYARPGKPRNGFRLGVAALRSAASELTALGIEAEFVSMGSPHDPVDLHGRPLVALGRLAWDQYHEVLGSIDVLLSLQFSPHPSHPPLDQVASGGFAVTNEVGTSRRELNERLIAVPPFVDTLSAAIVRAVLETRTATPAAWDPTFIDALGRPLADVVHDVAAGLR
jgi:hypothetical protein